jgi:hypothetical protein
MAQQFRTLGRPVVDGVLLLYGTELFYPRSNRGQGGGPVRLKLPRIPSASNIRERIQATVDRVPQVMVKITGGSRGMERLRSHLTYITRHGELPLTNEREDERLGMAGVMATADDFRWGGSEIPEHSHRKEALHIALGMPAGTPEAELRAAVEDFARRELGNHQWCWAFHGDQEHPHVHLAVRIEGRDLQRLNPRKADLHRWRETFAQALQVRGIRAEATRRYTRGVLKAGEREWRLHAGPEGRVRQPRPQQAALSAAAMHGSLTAWGHIHNALAASEDAGDQRLAREVKRFLSGTQMVQAMEAAAMREERLQQAQEVPAQKRSRGRTPD